MRNVSIFLILELLLITHVEAAAVSKCNTNLDPTDKTSKYIEAVQCLNKNIEEMNKELDGMRRNVDSSATNAAAATEAANRAAESAHKVSEKLDRLLRRSMMQ